MWYSSWYLSKNNKLKWSRCGLIRVGSNKTLFLCYAAVTHILAKSFLNLARRRFEKRQVEISLRPKSKPIEIKTKREASLFYCPLSPLDVACCRKKPTNTCYCRRRRRRPLKMGISWRNPDQESTNKTMKENFCRPRNGSDLLPSLSWCQQLKEIPTG